MNQQTKWQIEKIIEVANDLHKTGRTSASTGEVIAAAFVLNKPEYLPASYQDMVEAWDRLGTEWQHHVRAIKQYHMHKIQEDEA